MASVSVSHMILFIASMLIAASVAGAFTTSVDRLSGAIEDQGVAESESIRTDIEIISTNGTGAPVYDGTTLTLLVKNTGTTTLPADPDQIEGIVDGQYTPAANVSVEIVSGADQWRRGDVVRLNVTQPGLSSGDHRAKVIVNGDEEIFEFRIP